MSLDLAMTNGTRRFLEYARAHGYEPLLVEMKPSEGATTLVYRTYRTYFLVFQRQYPKQMVPRHVIRRIISGKDIDPHREFRIRNLEAAYKDGEESVREEMQSGYMTPFVSPDFTDFSVYLDERSFKGGSEMSFPAGATGNGFALPARAVKDLLTGLYGTERVFVRELLQ